MSISQTDYAYAKAKIGRGICRYGACSNPLVNRSYCDVHRQVTNKSQRRRYSPVKAWINNLCIRYKLTPDDLTRLLVRQNFVCALCHEPPDKPNHQNFVIDHDPISGRVRGIIHKWENTTLGMLGDTPSAVRRWLVYVEG